MSRLLRHCRASQRQRTDCALRLSACVVVAVHPRLTDRSRSQAPVRHGARVVPLHLPRARQSSVQQACAPSLSPSLPLASPSEPDERSRTGWGDSADDDKKDRDRVGIVQEREYDRLPRHLRDEWDRRPSKVDPDVSGALSLALCDWIAGPVLPRLTALWGLLTRPRPTPRAGPLCRSAPRRRHLPVVPPPQLPALHGRH